MDLDALLPPEVRATLARVHAAKVSYSVRYLMSPDRRLLVAVGEAHLKFAPALALGKELVGHFALRGVETFPVRRVAFGRLLGVLIHYPRVLLRILSLGLVKGSTITDAKALPTGCTFELERDAPIPLGLHVGAAYLAAFFLVFWLQLALMLAHTMHLPVDAPLWWMTALGRIFQLHMIALLFAIPVRRRSWSWLVHPAVAILTLRDVTMAQGTVAMLRAEPEPRRAVVIMGRAHLAGYERVLVEQHGFRSLA